VLQPIKALSSELKKSCAFHGIGSIYNNGHLAPHINRELFHLHNKKFGDLNRGEQMYLAALVSLDTLQEQAIMSMSYLPRTATIRPENNLGNRLL
jgi:hypothetical protein